MSEAPTAKIRQVHFHVGILQAWRKFILKTTRRTSTNRLNAPREMSDSEEEASEAQLSDDDEAQASANAAMQAMKGSQSFRSRQRYASINKMKWMQVHNNLRLQFSS